MSVSWSSSARRFVPGYSWLLSASPVLTEPLSVTRNSVLYQCDTDHLPAHGSVAVLGPPGMGIAETFGIATGRGKCHVEIKITAGNGEFLAEKKPCLYVRKSMSSVMSNATQENFIGGRKIFLCQNDPATHALLINVGEFGLRGFLIFFFSF